MKKLSAFAFVGIAATASPFLKPMASEAGEVQDPSLAPKVENAFGPECEPSGSGTLVDSKDLVVTTSSPAGNVKVGTVYLWYDSTCRKIRTSYQTVNNCSDLGDLGPLYCGSVELWRSTDGTLQETASIPYGGNKAITEWYDDAGVEHYGKAWSPAVAGVAPATSVATIAY